ncbi:hypothetical protein ACG7TL_006634 [Trametes sanguinea]
MLCVHTMLPFPHNAHAFLSKSRQTPRVDGSVTAPPSSPSGNADDGTSGQSGQDTGASSNQSAASGASGNSSLQSSQGQSSQQSSDPSSQPSSQPSSNPPTSPPSSQPTTQPSSQPPTSPPSSNPTTGPSSQPSSAPPSSQPTSQPSSAPSSDPSSLPSSDPSSAASSQPPASSSDASQSSAANTNSTALFAGAQSTITSAIATTVIDGQTTTLFTTIPTTLSDGGSNDNLSSTKRGIIAGSVGGAALLILVTAVFLFYRRHQHKKLSFFKRFQPKPRARLLDEDEDFDLSPPMARYSDYPASVASSQSHSKTPSQTAFGGPSTPSRSPNAPSFDPSLLGTPMDPNRTPTPNGSGGAGSGGLPPGAAAPHLMPMRAESGSIFREAVWPPPGEHSAFVDPIVSASSAVDLGRIVDDIMGPGGAGGAGSAGANAGAGPPSAYRGPASANASSTSMIPDDPFASLTALNVPHASHEQTPPSAMHSRETSETPLLPKPSPFSPYRDHDRSRGATPEPPGSPVPMPRTMGPLFVTNMGPLSPDATSPPVSPTEAAQRALGQLSPVSPPPMQPSASQGSTSRNWLERSPKKAVRPSLERERGQVEGAAASAPAEEAGADVTELSSAGHGIGEAL